MDALIKMYISMTGDDYAYYWNKQEYEDYVKELNGEGVGIGVLVNYLEDKGAINVLFVYPDSPAEAAGLEPGDLIYTGTPSGVALEKREDKRRWLEKGDKVDVVIEGIGTLTNYMV